MAELIKQGEEVGHPSEPAPDEDVRSLKQTMIYGLKGVAAYAYHARILGKEDERIYAFLHEGLA